MKIIYSKYTFEEVHNTRRTETEAEDIRENGTFDFSYLDEEWEKIKIKE